MGKLWDAGAWKDYLEWHDSDHRVWSRINDLLKEIERDPFSGTGRPHPLKFDRQGYWSRGITQMNRLVYRVEDNVLIILDCCGHYE
jgi:toxin YoeB